MVENHDVQRGIEECGLRFRIEDVHFIMDQGNKVNASLKTMKVLIASCTELFPIVVESLEEGESSSSYYDLTPHDMVEIQGVAVEGGNQHAEDVD